MIFLPESGSHKGTDGWKKWLFVFLAAAVAAWILITNVMIHPARFETNDDPAIAAIAYGVNGEYDSHLIFINIIWGKLLTSLLSAYPDVAWYPILECAVIAVSFAAIFFVFFQRFGIRNAWIPIFLLAFYFGSQYFTILQFSRTAGIACTAGMLLLLYSAESSKRWPSVIIGLMLCVVGSFYRFDVFEMLLIPFCGAGAFAVFSYLKQREWLSIFRIMLFFGLMLLLCSIFNAYDENCYSEDPNWSDFREFNTLRSELLDRGFPDYDKNEELYESLNISKDDLILFTNWDFDDPDIFNIDSMRKLVAAKEKIEIDLSYSYLHRLVPQLFEYSFMQCFVVAAVLCLLFSEKGTLSLLLYELLALFGIEFYFLFIGRLGVSTISLLSRLDVSLILAATVVVMYFGFSTRVYLKKRITLALVAAMIAGTALINQEDRNLIGIATNDYVERERQAFSDMHEDTEHLYAYSTLAFNDLGLIWSPRALGSRSNSIALGGWKTHTHTRQYVMDAYGISNPFRDVVDNPSMYFMAAPNSEMELQIRYIRNHYEPNAQAIQIRRIANTYSVYRVVSEKPVPNLENEIADSPKTHLRIDSFSRHTDGKVTISGELYVSGEKAIDTMLYMSVTRDGVTDYHVIPQTMNPLEKRTHREGKYRYFEAELSEWREGDQIRFYVDASSGLYSVDMNPALNPIEKMDEHN